MKTSLLVTIAVSCVVVFAPALSSSARAQQVYQAPVTGQMAVPTNPNQAQIDQLIAERDAVDVGGPIGLSIAGGVTAAIGLGGSAILGLGYAFCGFSLTGSSSGGSCQTSFGIATAVAGGIFVIGLTLMISGLIWLSDRHSTRNRLQDEIDALAGGGVASLRVMPIAGADHGGLAVSYAF